MPRSEKPPKRLYVDAPLEASSLVLDAERAHYLGRVLRSREGDRIVVFNARGTERMAEIRSLARRHPSLSLGDIVEPLPEPAAPVCLLQSLVKSDAMDLIVQKATELGATEIIATRTDFSVIRLEGEERRNRRLGHWNRIAVSACEQSGRHRPPALTLCDSLEAAIAVLPEGCRRIAFETGASNAPNDNTGGAGGICLAIGPEGGFSPSESRLLETESFEVCSLGPRTLRADTAAIAALATVRWLAAVSIRGTGR